MSDPGDLTVGDLPTHVEPYPPTRADPQPGSGSGGGGFWRGIIVGVALGVWVASLALWALWSDDGDSGGGCQTVACCGGCTSSSGHPHAPPVNIAYAPPGPAQYFCGLSDHGGGFLWDHGGGALWDHGGGYLWDHGGGSLWDHGGGYVWDHGGGYLWDHGGGFVWDHGGGFVWDSNLGDTGPVPGSPVVPVPTLEQLGRDRNAYEFRCDIGAGGVNDVVVLSGTAPVVIVMPDGNVDHECFVDPISKGPRVDPRVNPLQPGDPESDERAYCMVTAHPDEPDPDDQFVAHELVDPEWVD